MAEQLGNPRRGQYFTPYDVADMMGRITLGTAGAEMKRKGYITVNDQHAGLGSCYLLGRTVCAGRKSGVESNVLFVGQDIGNRHRADGLCSIVAGRVSGYVVIGDSLSGTVDRECFEGAGQCLGDAG